MRQWWIGTVLLLTACGGGGGGGPTPPGGGPSPNYRPAGSPDVVVISISGRCEGGLCFSPDSNEPYLGAPGDAGDWVVASFLASGQSVERADIISSFFSFDDDGDDEADRHGFLELVFLLRAVHETWIQGFVNPTRIVLLAHSHGCVWAHIATSVLSTVPIAYLISLDGNCFAWEGDYASAITAYFNANGNPYSWDIRDPCDHWLVPGQADAQDTEDVVWPNVGVNLEVRSDDLFIFDPQPNYRTNGSRTAVYTFDSATDNHSGVHDPGGDSMPWVTDMLLLLGH